MKHTMYIFLIPRQLVVVVLAAGVFDVAGTLNTFIMQ